MDLPIRAYRHKLIRSGDIIEIYYYEQAIRVGHKRKKRKQKRPMPKVEVVKSEEEKEQEEFKQVVKSEFSLRRTKANIVRLVNSNPELKVFITLTFDDSKSKTGSFTDIKECNLIFSNFIKRLKRFYPDLLYLAVPEFQGDYYFKTKIKKENGGNVHYHMLSNLPYTDSSRLEEIWSYGFIKINNIRHVSRVGLYVAKYIAKELFDGRLSGKKKIFYSRKLKRPEIVVSALKVRQFIDALESPSELLVDKWYKSDFVGRVSYQLYKNG